MTPRPTTDACADLWTFPRKVLLVAFALLLALMVWQLLDLIMLVFGAVIVATLLRSLASALERHARLPTQISVIAVLFLLVFMIAAVAWFVGDPLAKQFEILRQRLPTAVDAVMQWLNCHRIGVATLQYIEEARSQDASPWAMRLAGVAGSTFGALGGAALVLVMGLYLAMAPRVYRDGLVRLMPLSVRARRWTPAGLLCRVGCSGNRYRCSLSAPARPWACGCWMCRWHSLWVCCPACWPSFLFRCHRWRIAGGVAGFHAGARNGALRFRLGLGHSAD
jgi:hypothetical protein